MSNVYEIDFTIEISAECDDNISLKDAIFTIMEQWTMSDGLEVDHEGVHLSSIIILDPLEGDDYAT